MAAIEGLLQRGEIVHLKLRPHGVVFLRAAIWTALGAALFAAAPLAGQMRLWALAGGLFVCGGLAAAIEAALRRAGTELAVTDRRVVLRTGRLGETVSEAFGPAISGLEVASDALSRRLGYAWFRIPGLGRDVARLPFGQPDLLRSRIEELAMSRTVRAAPIDATVEPAPKPTEANPKPQIGVPTVRLAVLNEAVGPTPRRKSNGDARPKANGDARATLHLQPELDRF